MPEGGGGSLSPPADVHGCTLCMHHLSIAHSYAALALHHGVHRRVHASACSHACPPGLAVSAHRLADHHQAPVGMACADSLPGPSDIHGPWRSSPFAIR